MDVVLKPPAECTDAELRDFRTLVVEAGEVQTAGLDELIGRAHLLAFVGSDWAIVAVGALKRPRDAHRARVFKKAASSVGPEPYSLELGWISVGAQRRRQGLGTMVSVQLCKVVEGPLYATARADNDGMRHILEGLGFRQEGKPYAGRNETLALYLRGAGG